MLRNLAGLWKAGMDNCRCSQESGEYRHRRERGREHERERGRRRRLPAGRWWLGVFQTRPECAVVLAAMQLASGEAKRFQTAGLSPRG